MSLACIGLGAVHDAGDQRQQTDSSSGIGWRAMRAKRLRGEAVQRLLEEVVPVEGRNDDRDCQLGSPSSSGE